MLGGIFCFYLRISFIWKKNKKHQIWVFWIFKNWCTSEWKAWASSVMSKWTGSCYTRRRHPDANLMVGRGGGEKKQVIFRRDWEAQKWLHPRVCTGSAALHTHQSELHTNDATQSRSQIYYTLFNHDCGLTHIPDKCTEITPSRNWMGFF